MTLDPAVAAHSPRAALLALLAALPDRLPDVHAIGEAIDRTGGPGAWADLVAEASAHGVAGVIGPHLAPFALPSDVRRSLGQRLEIARLWHQHVAASLGEAVSLLAAAGVRVCVLKGPPLAARLYSEPAARPSIDIDLLVDPADVETAARALADAGYLGDSATSAAYLLRHAHHLHFWKANHPLLELHFHSYAGFGVVLPASALLDRAVAFRGAGAAEVLVPSAEDELIYLTAHAAGHSFIRLVWLYDVKLLVRRHAELDWERVADRAAALGVRTPVAYTLRLLSDWLGVALDGLPASLRPRGWRPRLADRLLAAVSTPQPPSIRDNLGGLIFTSLLCDRPSSGAWLIQHHLLRTMRRRLKRLAPAYLPARWSA